MFDQLNQLVIQFISELLITRSAIISSINTCYNVQHSLQNKPNNPSIKLLTYLFIYLQPRTVFSLLDYTVHQHGGKHDPFTCVQR